MYHKVQTATAGVGPGDWTDATTAVLFRENAAITGDPAGTYTDNNPAPGKKFYPVVRSLSL
jgi:hypothetical protein